MSYDNATHIAIRLAYRHVVVRLTITSAGEQRITKVTRYCNALLFGVTSPVTRYYLPVTSNASNELLFFRQWPISRLAFTFSISNTADEGTCIVLQFC